MLKISSSQCWPDMHMHNVRFSSLAYVLHYLALPAEYFSLIIAFAQFVDCLAIKMCSRWFRDECHVEGLRHRRLKDFKKMTQPTAEQFVWFMMCCVEDK